MSLPQIVSRDEWFLHFSSVDRYDSIVSDRYRFDLDHRLRRVELRDLDDCVGRVRRGEVAPTKFHDLLEIPQVGQKSRYLDDVPETRATCLQDAGEVAENLLGLNVEARWRRPRSPFGLIAA